MSVKAQENGQEARDGSSKDPNQDFTAITDRLHFLEKEYKQLSALFHDLLAKPKRGGQEETQFVGLKTASTAVCEIARLSSVEWRAIEDLEVSRTEYSLLTVGPKGRGESESRNQKIKVHPEAGKAAIEASAEPTKAPESSDETAYRLILNGRAELMEVLGPMFNSQALPGFYIWIWPFKYLISYEQKVRARLLEEESKFKDVEKPPASTVPPESVNETGSIPNGDQLQPDCGQGSGNLSLDVAHVNGRDPKPEHQVSRDSHKVREDEGETKVRFKTLELGSMAEHHIATATTHEASQTEAVVTETQNSKVLDTAQKTPQSVQGEANPTDRTRLRDELRCLVKFMDDDMKKIHSAQKGIDDGTKTTIAFDYLWQLFKPGDLVIKGGEQKRAYIVLHVTGGRALHRSARSTHREKDRWLNPQELLAKEAYLAKYPKTTPFVLDCFYLDFDGTNFGPRPEKFMFQEYDGEVPINSLEVFPAKFDESPKQTEKALVKRGKRFVKLTRVDHKYYSGKTIRELPVFDTQSEVHGEIMIDFDLAIKSRRQDERYRFHKWDVSFYTGVIANPTPIDERELDGYQDLISEESPQYKPTYFMEVSYDSELSNDFTDKSPLLEEQPHSEKLSNEALMLLPPRVYGFSLLDREWYAFDIGKVEDIKGSNRGFEHLILPGDHKRIMQALVQHHTKGPAPISAEVRRTDQEFSMDVIRGKGRGLVILLHGVPGVGKTSTAESVAAQTRRPLLPITCGDIGTTPGQVEARLNKYFDMAHKWGCVLLLDEADVFLTKRETGGDLERNAIVSVFLRVLEYYSGILILTTNRIGEFDEAFSSRVHIKLYYPKLDKKSTLEIWKMNMKHIAESELDIDVEAKEIRKFARKLWVEGKDKQTQRWNGRQIRNAFQTAIALAKYENAGDSNQRPCLSARQFEIVAETSAHFDNYISKMHGIEIDDVWEAIAARDFLRKNETPRKPTSRSAMAARAKEGRRGSMRADSPDEDEEDDETDSDESEEEMRKLLAKFERKQKKIKGLAVKRHRDTTSGQSQKSMPHAKADDEDSSNDSDAAD